MSRNRFLLGVLCLALAGSAADSATAQVAYNDDYDREGNGFPDRSTWRSYFRTHAQVRLGEEKRLPSGVSWRLHIDRRTKLAMPRITWMPDRARMQIANEMFEMLHGGLLLEARDVAASLVEVNRYRREMGQERVEFGSPLVQTEIDLTYASAAFISVLDMGYSQTDGNMTPRFIHAMTFDLARGSIFKIDACPGGAQSYAKNDHLFRFGDLLSVCDPVTYDHFMGLVRRKALALKKQAAVSVDPRVVQCRGELELFGQHRTIALYLSFTGLAVLNTAFNSMANDSTCALTRSAINPIVIPYRELAPLMKPGPWRDELLK